MLKKLSYLSKKIVNVAPELVAIILYGSYARGEAGKKSDIDLLMVLEKRSTATEEKIRDVVESTAVGRKVIPVFTTAKELVKTPYYAFDIIKDGIILYKTPERILRLPFAFGERAVSIYTFNAAALPQKRRAKFNRQLYGTGVYKKVLKTKKEKKRYRYPGLLDKVHGRRLGAGSIMAPSRAEKDIEKLFSYFRVKFEKVHLLHIEDVY